jgi:hypothetical protein
MDAMFLVMMEQSRWRAKNKAPARLPSPKAGSASGPESVQVRSRSEGIEIWKMEVKMSF